jgi:phosphate transport system ATP-binding protein
MAMMEELVEKEKKVSSNHPQGETRKIEVSQGQTEAASGPVKPIKIKVNHLNGWFGEKQALFDINMDVLEKEVTAIIGPSGCGKSTLIRCFNRMHETVPSARHDGDILLEQKSIFSNTIDPVEVRRRIGMVFQKPTPFPTLSIYDNVVVGLRLNGTRDKKVLDEVVEKSLRKAALWEEVKDSLHRPGAALSGGQQQRLCIARALAIDLEVLLMDEPCSALDPISTSKIEELIHELRQNYTIIIVTHNMQQAARVSQKTAFMLNGKLIEFNPTEKVFTNPDNKLTEDYITGRFG